MATALANDLESQPLQCRNNAVVVERGDFRRQLLTAERGLQPVCYS